MKKIIETFFAAVMAIQPDSIKWPEAIAKLLEELVEQNDRGKPAPLKNLDRAKFAGNAAYQKAVEVLQVAWTALLTTTPQISFIPPSSSAPSRSPSSFSSSSSSPSSNSNSNSNSTFAVPNQPLTAFVATKPLNVTSNANVFSTSSSPVPSVANPSDLIKNRINELNANTTKPIPKQVSDIQGKSLEDKFRDAAKLIKVDQDFLASLNGKPLLTPPGTAPNIELIKKLIDPLLQSDRIVNETDDAQVSLVLNARLYAGAIQTVLKYYGLDKVSDPKHWIAKGKLLHANPSVPFVCDGSAAIAFYMLYADPSVGCHLAIVEQGQANTTGHWFVMAYKDNKSVDSKQGMCIVDVWGADFMKLKSAVQNQTFVVLQGGEKKNTQKVTCWL